MRYRFTSPYGRYLIEDNVFFFSKPEFKESNLNTSTCSVSKGGASYSVEFRKLRNLSSTPFVPSRHTYVLRLTVLTIGRTGFSNENYHNLTDFFVRGDSFLPALKDFPSVRKNSVSYVSVFRRTCPQRGNSKRFCTFFFHSVHNKLTDFLIIVVSVVQLLAVRDDRSAPYWEIPPGRL